MKILRILLTAALATQIVSTVFAKDMPTGVYTKAKKITTAEETVKIIPSLDIPDPNRPKEKYTDGNFGVKFYTHSSKGWDNLGKVTKIEKKLNSSGVKNLRFVVEGSAVSVMVEQLKYWQGVEWYQPIATLYSFDAATDKAYDVQIPYSHKKYPEYRIVITNEKKSVKIPLVKEFMAENTEQKFLSEDDRIYGITPDEPMSHLLRVYAYWTARKKNDVRIVRDLYWRTIATSWAMVMGGTAPLDEDGYYHSTEWFFDEFAYALFPEINWPDLRIEDHVLWFPERPEPYVIRRRTFDINYVTIIEQRREGNQLIATMKVKGDRKDKDKLVDIYMSPVNRYKHPFAWKIEKGVIL